MQPVSQSFMYSPTALNAAKYVVCTNMRRKLLNNLKALHHSVPRSGVFLDRHNPFPDARSLYPLPPSIVRLKKP